MRRWSLALSLVVVAHALGCPGPGSVDGGDDAGKGRADAGGLPVYNGDMEDAGSLDAGVPDGGAREDAGAAEDAGAVDDGGAVADAGAFDAGSSDDAGSIADGGAAEDAGARDAGGLRDAGPVDAGIVNDAGPVDAGPGDAGPVDAGATCLPLASGGIPIALDGVDDLGKYPASQILTPDPLTLNQPWELFGLAWDRDFLYVTQVSQGFEDEYEPLHVYLEASDALGTPTSTTGKEYSGLTPALPFAPTHVVAARVTDGVDAYNGVYTPDAQWSTKALALVSGVDVFVSADRHTLAARVPLEALGCPTHLRLAAHVVHDVVVANEWKDVVPTGHTPWAAPGGAYYEIDLTADPSVSSWTLRP